MSESNLNQANQNSDNKQEIEKKKEKKKKAKENEKEIVLILPDKAKTFKAKVENCIILILKSVDIINEKDLITRLILECETAKEYFKKTQDVGYLRIILWKMARKGIIKRARILGDGRRRYYLLPEKLEQLKDRIMQGPGE
ncbi:hypothetical protein GFS03_08205 [Sulfolobus sp. E5-1-F]|uniref:hypothetical protein n=1 Tax=Saccharolobus sp. E5-1-F TaxID=2663019 RepID=UPI001295502B|nr:hypothetical protein [Sulfolobus sp. E5-1-F]QGA54553.1 hypothetical protein GFS03_08205 [Sulfolobus sp. E5-1-F]